MNCEMARQDIPLYYYGELAAEQEEVLEEHLHACADCQRELEQQRLLAAALDKREVEIPPGLLPECRHDLMRAVYRNEGPAAAAPAKPSPWALFREGFAALWNPRWLQPVGAVALVAVGFLSARLTSTSPTAPEPVTSTVRSVQPDASGRVQIALDETRRRVISGRLEDRNIQNLLLAASREESNPSVRVESVDLLKDQTPSNEVRDALLDAVGRDRNPGVRLKAVEGLKKFAGDLAVRKALAQVLLRDEVPGVRIQAIDILTAQRDVSMVGVLQNLVQRDSNSYVRLRCEKALKDMNASVGTF